MTKAALPAAGQNGYSFADDPNIEWGTIGKYKYREEIPDESHLYFVLDADWHCKIGRSKDVDARMCSLQTAHPRKIVLILYLPRMGWQEIVWHYAFQHIALGGEWHLWRPELWRCIEAAWKGRDWPAEAVGPEFPDGWTQYIRDMEADAYDRAIARRQARVAKQAAICDPTVIPDCTRLQPTPDYKR